MPPGGRRGPGIEIGVDVDSARRSINEILHALEESVERTQDSAVGKRFMEIELKKLKVMHEQQRLAKDGLKTATEELRLFEKKFEITEKMERSQAASSSRALRSVEQVLNVVGNIARSGQQADWKGWIGSARTRFIGDVLGNIPVVGGLAKSVADIFGNEQERQEKRADLRYTLFRDYGPRARNSFMATDQPGALQDLMIEMGALPEDRARVLSQLGRAGVGGEGFLPLLSLQQGYGLGEAGAGMMGALKRAGVGDTETIKALGDAMGVATATGLKQGRWDETMGEIARAAQQSSSGFFSYVNTLALATSVGSMGPAFAGAGPAGRKMFESLNALSRGEGGPLAPLLSLQAAGLGTGTDYFTAAYRASLGVTEGGPEQAKQDAVLKNFADQMGAAQVWASGDEGGKNAIVMILAPMIGWSPALTRQRLDFLYRGMDRGNLAQYIGVGMNTNLAGGRIPKTEDLYVRQAAAKGAALNRGSDDVLQLLPPLLRDMASNIQTRVAVDAYEQSTAAGGDISTRQAAARGAALTGSTVSNVGIEGSAGRFSSPVERWRSMLRIVGPAYGLRPENTDFYLSWMQREAGGKYGPGETTRYNERGFFQVMGAHPDVIDEQGHLHRRISYAQSEAGEAGIPEALFNLADKDPMVSMQVGAMLVAHREREARQLVSQYGLNWVPEDVNKLTKYLHAAPAQAYRDLKVYKKAFGRAPASFDDLGAVTEQDVGHKKWFNQAREVGSVKVDVNLSGSRPQASVRVGGATAPGKVTATVKDLTGP